MKTTPLTQLGHLSVQEFLRDYWQKKPVVLRQVIPNFQSPITPDELAGLSLEEEIESRIIIEHGKTPWELKKGPFEENLYSQLPASHWTLLIQAADQYLPEVSDLLEEFRFLPSWRLDDIMISYATEGGSVGPHYDQYDVFLLQAGGQRQWQIGQHCDHKTPILADTELHIINQFEKQQAYTLDPGDILYLPPQVAHWGTALDNDCITYSVGFRAPSKAEILEELLQECLMDLSEDDRFSDPNLVQQDNPGRISSDSLHKVQDVWKKALDSNTINEWFGRYMTQPKYQPADTDEIDPQDITWTAEENFQRNPSSRFAYIENNHQHCDLFVDGEKLPASLALAETLCREQHYSGQTLSTLASQASDTVTLKLLIAGEKLEPLD